MVIFLNYYLIFINNNKNKCKIIYEEKEYEMKENWNIDDKPKNDILEIKLKRINNITDMSYMFNGCSNLSNLPDISKWNTNSVTNMSNIFNGCSNLLSLPDISKWNTKNVTNMSFMFNECSKISSLPDISKWNTNSVKNMSYMFNGCSNLSNLPNIFKWNTNNVINMDFMFNECRKLRKLNNYILLSIILFQNELLLNTSFSHLIKFHFYNYLSEIKKEKQMSGISNSNSFIVYLREIIKNANIIDKKEIKEKIKELNNYEDINRLKYDFENIIKEIKGEFIGEELNLGISENDFNKDKKDDNEEFNIDATEEDENENCNNNINAFNACDIIKIIYIFQKEKKFIPQPSEETNNLLKYFKQKEVVKKKYIYNTNDLMDKSSLNKEIIKALKDFSKEIKHSKINNENYKFIKDEILKLIEYLKTYDVIFIPFLGGSNAGKTTIINGIIGKDILPNDMNECTKRGILIRYENTEEIILRKANFESEKVLDKTNYFFHAGNEICKGEENVKETLKGLNYDFNENEEDSFYYLRTRIKLFDEMGLDQSLKEMIYLIDFPGFGTGNVFEQNIYNKAMSICNSFVFVVRNSVIKENTAKRVLDSIFTQAKEQKGKLTSQFIKSCLFVLNNEKSQTTNPKDLEKAKKDVQTVINGININDINLCFFNAKYYLNYCNNFNYFSNIKELIDNEYKNYNYNKSLIIKNPELAQVNVQKSFCKYFYEILVNKKELFDAKMKKNQQISPEIESDITQKFNEISERENMEDLKKYENYIKLILSFFKENINNMKTLKESNISGFKSILYSQIKSYNDNIQEEIKVKLNNIIDTFV
mgnify:CR=1 FL=1